MKKHLIWVLMVILVLGCKEKKPPEPTLTTMEILTDTGSKQWHLVKAVGLGDNESKVDLILNRPCLKDNLLILKADGTYVLEDTGEACSDITTVKDRWTLTEKPLQLGLGSITLLDRTFENVILEISEINSNSFEGTVNNVPANPLGMKGVIMRFDAVK